MVWISLSDGSSVPPNVHQPPHCYVPFRRSSSEYSENFLAYPTGVKILHHHRKSFHTCRPYLMLYTLLIIFFLCIVMKERLVGLLTRNLKSVLHGWINEWIRKYYASKRFGLISDWYPQEEKKMFFLQKCRNSTYLDPISCGIFWKVLRNKVTSWNILSSKKAYGKVTYRIVRTDLILSHRKK